MAAPVQVPGSAVRVCPSRASPERDGPVPISGGAAAPIGPTAALWSSPVPDTFVAVTPATIRAPMSSSLSRYVSVVAPATGIQGPLAGQRDHV